jgi:hypothetical protein
MAKKLILNVILLFFEPLIRATKAIKKENKFKDIKIG